MKKPDDHELNRLLDATVRGMVEYLEGNEEDEEEEEDRPTYTTEDIEACRTVLLSHANLVQSASNAEEGLKIVRRTVERLNDLNEEAGGELIETDQREDICMYIIRCGFLRGFNRADEDVTEEWREW